VRAYPQKLPKLQKMFNAQLIKKVTNVRLRRISDSTVFLIDSPCVLQLPGELVLVLGAPNEALNNDIWDVSQKFEVIDLKTK
jgi:hypothetical protein